MIKRVLGAALSVAVMSMAHGASAEDFTFTFQGSGNFPGTVTGTISGLDANGTSSASSVTASVKGSSYVFPGTSTNSVYKFQNTFTTSNGVLTAGNFASYIFTPTYGQLYLNNSPDGSNGLSVGSTLVAGQSGFSNVTYTAVASTNPFASSAVSAVSAAPEPGTWALMLGGVGMIGAMMRVAQARRREDELKSLATA